MDSGKRGFLALSAAKGAKSNIDGMLPKPPLGEQDSPDPY